MYSKRFSRRLVCTIVCTTMNNYIGDIANNVKFSKFKNQFLLPNQLMKKALICVNASSILLVAKSIKEFSLLKCEAISKNSF